MKNTRTTLVDSDWFYNIVTLVLKYTQTTLLNLDWFYNILDLHLKNTRTLLDSDRYYETLDLDQLISQAGMPLQTYEGFPELSVKQLVDHLSVHPH